MGADRAGLAPPARSAERSNAIQDGPMPHENFVATDWLAAHLGEPDLGVIDASWHLPPTGRAGDAEFLPGPYPRRGVLQHRRHRGYGERAAAHAAGRGRLRQGDDRAGPGRRHAFRRLRHARPVRLGARVVDLARIRRAGGVAPRRRVPEVAARGPADRDGRRPPETADLHSAPRPQHGRLARRRAQGAARAAPRKSSMRGPRTVSRAVRPSRAPA